MAAGNSKATAKAKGKPRGKPLAKGYDPRRNLEGAPKRGTSWAELYNFYGDMTPVEAAEHVGKIANKLKAYGDRITLKEAVVITVYSSMLFSPSPGLLSTMQDRMEGKVKEQIQIDGLLDVEGLSAVMKKVYSGKGEDQSG